MWLRLEPLVPLGAPMCFSPFPFAALCRRYLRGIMSLALVFFLPTFWLLVVAACGAAGVAVLCHGMWPTMEVDTRQTPCVCFEVCLFQASAWSFSVILLRPSRSRNTPRREHQSHTHA